jgi:putative ABC transport system permease protein
MVKNFHIRSIHRPIEPIFIVPQTGQFSSLLIKTNGNNNEVGNHLKQLCEGVAPGILCEYEILDENIAEFYVKEKNQMGMIGFFSLVALTLSLMGLFGFVSLNLAKRTKEIGIRIINGAKSSELVNMLNYQYLKYVIAAFIIACPIAWYAMNKWLEGFAYKTELSWWIFTVAGAVAMIIALLTVSWQSWRAATRNPVEALRYE